MKRKITFLNVAHQDMEELRSYVRKNFGTEVWQTTYQKMKEALTQIQKFPESGVIPDELDNLSIRNYRQILSGLNRIIYEVGRDAVYIHLICDARKSFVNLLLRRILTSKTYH